jgi:hypothetical protein
MDVKPPRLLPGLVVALGILCLGLAVYAVFTSQKLSALESELATRATSAAPPLNVASAAGSTGDAKLLRQLLEEKENAYQRLYEQYEQWKQAGPSVAAPPAEARSSTNAGGFGRGRGGDFMDRLQREDPERFKQLQETQEQRRKQAEAQFQQQLARLQERRQKATTPEEIAHLDALAATMAKLQAIGQGWETVRSLSGEERSQQVRQLAEESAATYQSYNELKTKDRQLQLQQLAAQVGYRDAAQAEEFTAAIQRIYQETEPGMRGLMGRGMRGENNSPRVTASP